MQAIFHSLRGGSPETESSRGIFRRTDKLHVGFRPNLDGGGVTAGALDSLWGTPRHCAPKKENRVISRTRAPCCKQGFNASSDAKNYTMGDHKRHTRTTTVHRARSEGDALTRRNQPCASRPYESGPLSCRGPPADSAAARARDRSRLPGMPGRGSWGRARRPPPAT